MSMPKLVKKAKMLDVVKKAEKQELVKSEKDELMDVMKKTEPPNVIKKAKRQERAMMEKAKNEAKPRLPPMVLEEKDVIKKVKEELNMMEEQKLARREKAEMLDVVKTTEK